MDKKMIDQAGFNKDMFYRDSKTWYAQPGNAVKTVSQVHIDFCRKHAGNKILDFGCATGGYILELKKLGFECLGVDINEQYIEIASKRGAQVYLINERLPFDDKAFDTVIMFELLEHAFNPGKLLAEAKRVTRKNILITSPNCSDFESLKDCGLTYEHFLELDHVNFFTKDSLSSLLAGYFNAFEITENAPIYPWLFDTRSFPSGIVSILLRKIVSAMVRVRLLRPKYNASLFAVVNL